MKTAESGVDAMVTELIICRRQPARWLFACLTRGTGRGKNCQILLAGRRSGVLRSIRDLRIIPNSAVVVEGGIEVDALFPLTPSQQ